jgi:hypothetical protein
MMQQIQPWQTYRVGERHRVGGERGMRSRCRCCHTSECSGVPALSGRKSPALALCARSGLANRR